MRQCDLTRKYRALSFLKFVLSLMALLIFGGCDDNSTALIEDPETVSSEKSLEESWTRVQDMPTSRQEIYATVQDELVFIAGGILDDGLAFTNIFEAYDCKKNEWRSLPPLPEARHHVTLSAVGNEIFAIGGFEGPFPDWRALPSAFSFDLIRNTWRPSAPLPQAIGEHVAAVVDGNIYIIGGRIRENADSDHFDEHIDTDVNLVYEPSTKIWRNLSPAPTKRNSAAADVINGIIYVVGGRANELQDDGSQIQKNVATLESYDPGTDSWQTLAPMPLAQGGLAAAALDAKLYVFGGEQWTPERLVFPNAWVYDPSTDQWQAVDNLPTPRHGLVAASSCESIYVIGGATDVGGGTATGTNERFRPN